MPTRAHQPCREEAAPTIYLATLTKQPLPWASTISPGSVTSVSIPSGSSLSTSPTPEPFFPLDSLSTWPLTLSPSSPSPPYVRACPPPPTPSSPPPPSGSKLSLNQSDHGTHTGHLVTQVISTLPLETSHHGLVLSSSPVSTWPGGRRQQNHGASPP